MLSQQKRQHLPSIHHGTRQIPQRYCKCVTYEEMHTHLAFLISGYTSFIRYAGSPRRCKGYLCGVNPNTMDMIYSS